MFKKGDIIIDLGDGPEAKLYPYGIVEKVEGAHLLAFWGRTLEEVRKSPYKGMALRTSITRVKLCMKNWKELLQR